MGKRALIIAVVLIILLIVGWLVLFTFKTDDVAPIPISKTSTTTETDTMGSTTTPPVINGDEAAQIPDFEVFTEEFSNDKDRDGIDDSEEATLGTETGSFDSDGDGLSDRAEIDSWGTNPLNPDTDGDGFTDGFEVLGGYNPAGPGKL